MMNSEWNFTPEQKLLVLTARKTMTEEVKNQIREIFDNNYIDWFEFFKLALYHKTLTLVWDNIKKIKPNVNIPMAVRSVVEFTHSGIKERNLMFMKELEVILKELDDNGIHAVPVKGLLLIPTVYKDYGLRYMGDLDLLIKHVDIPALEKVMKGMGYIKGMFDPNSNTITPISRAEDIKWKMSMSNLFPFMKITNVKNTPLYKLDFRHSLDDNLNKEPINEIIKEYELGGKAKDGHLFVHLCTHFYDEAKHSLSIYSAKDINIIKLCDIREFYIHFMDDNAINDTVDFAKRYSLREQIYYTLYHLRLLYNDGYEAKFMEKLKIDDDSFLNTFGENTLNADQTFKKSFWERVFSCNNADELSEKPRYFEV